jgi:dihydroxyacid dehydratase/phosphogluconate dehydratase
LLGHIVPEAQVGGPIAVLQGESEGSPAPPEVWIPISVGGSQVHAASGQRTSYPSSEIAADDQLLSTAGKVVADDKRGGAQMETS